LDILEMKEFKNGEFNVVLDKGTLDSMLVRIYLLLKCGDNSLPNAEKMMSEVNRVLTPNGVYICITYGDEEHRKSYFASVLLLVI